MALPEKRREFDFSIKHFNAFRKISQNHTGIMVPDNKFEMFYSRLTKRLRTLKLNSFDEYLNYLKNHEDKEFTPFINALTTNLTSFFREPHHFDFLRKQLATDIRTNGTKKLHVWSAGCSTGEETYSIAITLAEILDLNRWRITATDIDTNVLTHAAEGVYSLDRLNNISLDTKKKWFLKGKGRYEGYGKVASELKKRIEFRQLNLVKPFRFDSPLDVIFCRNVVIYFDKNTKIELLRQFSANLKPKGYLIMGHSESLHGLTTQFAHMGKTVYQNLD